MDLWVWLQDHQTTINYPQIPIKLSKINKKSITYKKRWNCCVAHLEFKKYQQTNIK